MSIIEMDKLYIQTLTWMEYSQLLSVVRSIIQYCTAKSNLNKLSEQETSALWTVCSVWEVEQTVDVLLLIPLTVPHPCLWMYS